MKEKFDITEFRPCYELQYYYEHQASFEAAWQNCKRGSWMLWISQCLGVDDRLLTRAKAICANTVRHLMRDERSTAAIDAALRYANGEISREQLNEFANAANAAKVNLDTPYANHAAYAVYAAYEAATSVAHAAYDSHPDANTAACASYAAYAAAHAAADYAPAAAADYARSASRLQTANICLEVLTAAVLEKAAALN